MSTRTLTAVALGLSTGLLVVGWVLGFNTVEVATGLTTMSGCGSPWSPDIGAATPFSDSATPTAERCMAAFGARGVLGAVLAGCGFAGIIAVVVGRMIVDGVVRADTNGAARVKLGPRRKPSNPHA